MSDEGSAKRELPSRLSPSRAKDFDRCPQLYWFKTVHGCATPPSVAMIKGTLFHTVLERFFDLTPEQRTLETAVTYIEPAWETLLYPSRSRAEVAAGSPEAHLRDEAGLWADVLADNATQREWLNRQAINYDAFLDLDPEMPKGKKRSPEELRNVILAETRFSVTNFFEKKIEDLERLSTYQPKARELRIGVEVDGVPLFGIIDRLDHFTRADGTERWYISDYKTGKTPQPRYVDDQFFAMWIYALMLREDQGIVADELRLLFSNAQEKSQGDVRQTVTDEKLARTSQKIRKIWSDITMSFEEERWESKKSRLCDWCFFKTRGCPAFGGNPHEAPEDWIDAAFAEAGD